MRYSLLLVLTLFCFSCFDSGARAADSIFTSTTLLKEQALRLGNEEVEVVKTPFSLKDNAWLGTVAVAGAVGLTYVFDGDIRSKVQGTKSRGMDRVTDVGAAVGNPFVQLGVAGAVYGAGILADSPKYRERGEMLGEAALLADATGFVLKTAIGRGRPSVTSNKESFRPFQLKSEYDSTPSLHTASSFAMASVMSSQTESIPAKIGYYSAASFVGFSRIYQDKHWASDIVLGAAIGELCGRIVTGYHASHRKIALAPAVTDRGASLALVGRW